MNEVSTQQALDLPRPTQQPVELDPQAVASDRPRLAGVVETSGRRVSQDTPRSEQRDARNDAEDAAETAEAPEQAVGEAVTKLNDYMQSLQREIRISVDGDSGRPVIKVMDRKTEEVIRQIPNDLVLRLAQNLDDNEDVNLLDARI